MLICTDWVFLFGRGSTRHKKRKNRRKEKGRGFSVLTSRSDVLSNTCSAFRGCVLQIWCGSAFPSHISPPKRLWVDPSPLPWLVLSPPSQSGFGGDSGLEIVIVPILHYQCGASYLESLCCKRQCGLTDLVQSLLLLQILDL